MQPARYNEVANTVMRMLATASTELARIKASLEPRLEDLGRAFHRVRRRSVKELLLGVEEREEVLAADAVRRMAVVGVIPV